MNDVQSSADLRFSHRVWAKDAGDCVELHALDPFACDTSDSSDYLDEGEARRLRDWLTAWLDRRVAEDGTS